MAKRTQNVGGSRNLDSSVTVVIKAGLLSAFFLIWTFFAIGLLLTEIEEDITKINVSEFKELEEYMECSDENPKFKLSSNPFISLVSRNPKEPLFEELLSM